MKSMGTDIVRCAGLVLFTFGLLGGCADPANVENSKPVAENGGFRVEKPNGGETYSPGDLITICFSVEPAAIEEVKGNGGIIYLYHNGQKMFSDLQGEDMQVDFNDEFDFSKSSCYEWVIPESLIVKDAEGRIVYENGQIKREPLPSGDDYNVMVDVYNKGLVSKPVSDQSDGTFTIR